MGDFNYGATDCVRVSGASEECRFFLRVFTGRSKTTEKSVLDLVITRTTWLRTIGEDLQSQNFGVHMAWRKAKERDTWHQVVSTATLC